MQHYCNLTLTFRNWLETMSHPFRLWINPLRGPTQAVPASPLADISRTLRQMPLRALLELAPCQSGWTESPGCCEDSPHPASARLPYIREIAMHIIWTIIIGFIAGVIAKFITPGKNEPSGFVLTTILGIAGAFIATYLGQAIGWYRADQGAGLIGAVVGAVIILLIWGFIAGRRSPSP